MYRRFNKTILHLILALICLALLMTSALAGTSTSGGSSYSGGDSNLEERLRRVPDFKFWIHQNGIGYGNCPVYTAPSESAFRCANGRASCSTDYGMGEAGFVNGWLLVRYETNNGGVRVGYIPPGYVRGFKSEMGSPQFDYIPVTAAETIYVTDNPLLPGSSFAWLDPGESFHVLAKYTYYGNWWYIECKVDGQVARGFIDRDSSSLYLGDQSSGGGLPSSGGSNVPVTQSTLGNPSVSPLGTTQIGEVSIGYGSTGDRKLVRKRPDPDSEQVSVVYPGRIYPYYSIQRRTTGKNWYYLWIEEDSAWGWVSSAYATPIN